LPARIHKAALLIFVLGAASIFAAKIISDDGEKEKLFECNGGNRYILQNLKAFQEEEECFTLSAKLSTGDSGVLSIVPFRNILPINDPAFPFIKLMIFPKVIDDGRPKVIEGISIADLEFDGTDGLSVAPVPLAPGHYVGNPEIRRAPGGSPLLFGCTNYRDESASDTYNECSTSYRLKNGDTLFYSIAGIKGQRPTNWANIDKAVRDLIEAAERSALSR
jgi:hypothetical protein